MSENDCEEVVARVEGFCDEKEPQTINERRETDVKEGIDRNGEKRAKETKSESYSHRNCDLPLWASCFG